MNRYAMRGAAFTIGLLCAVPGWGAQYYFGATSAGSASGASGERWAMASVPWASLTGGDVVTWEGPSCAAGGTTCRMNINSTSANYSTTNPLIIDFNNATLDAQFGTTHVLYIKAAVGIHIKNLNVRHGTADGIRMDGSDGTIGLHDVTLDNVTSKANKQCGFDIDGLAYNVTLDRVVGNENYDAASPGNSDGMCTHFASGAGGAGIIIKDSEFAWNSDDGIDLFQTNNAVTMLRVHSHDNGYRPSGGLAGGDGRGVVLGPGVGAHIVESSIFNRNAQFGIHRRDNSAVLTLRNNNAVSNGAGISGGRNISFSSTVDLNFPTSQTRFADSGVNGEYRAVSQPVSSLSVGAQSYSAGTVGALAANQYGYSAPYVYVKGNPGTATVNAVPTTQSAAYNNVSLLSANADTRTGLTTVATNTWDVSITDPQWVGGSNPTTRQGFRLKPTSPLACAGTDVGRRTDALGRGFEPGCTPIGAMVYGRGDARGTALPARP